MTFGVHYVDTGLSSLIFMKGSAALKTWVWLWVASRRSLCVAAAGGEELSLSAA